MEMIRKAASVIRKGNGMVFTGAGISVESGIPPFRGNGGLWDQEDPAFIHLDFFMEHPQESWEKIRILFYDHWGKAAPNYAHRAVTDLWKRNWIKGVVTQNIDCLHQRAGMVESAVQEFHGTLDRLVCLQCSAVYPPEREYIDQTLPTCPRCGGILKPDFVFFGEDIPQEALEGSLELAEKASFCLVIGTTGEVMPACQIPRIAARNGAVVIEINPERSAFTGDLTEFYIPCKAVEGMDLLIRELTAL
ncbi:MAG: RNA polymerase subunit sigma [Lentisphaeria bacterium]|nr:RNA polymerase subunit sigma [Lentisphaeria bacterium]